MNIVEDNGQSYDRLSEEIAIELELMAATVRELSALQHDLAGREPTVREKTATAAFLAQFYNGCSFHAVAGPSGRRLPALAMGGPPVNQLGKEPVISGILNIDKPRGWTSHDVVAKVRRLSGQKRVGHAGTLDPPATGVLLVCLGQATRVSEYLMRGRKVYRAAVYLGLSTDTYDADGQFTAGAVEVNVTWPQLEEALSAFVGRIQQTPPMYSALKHQGTPLYKLARQGKTVERKPRTVEIYDIKLLDWSSPVLTIEVACSPGTYLRSLAHDLGQWLGCGAHLSSLTRLASGHFTLDEAIGLDTLSEAFATGRWAELIYPLDAALLDFEAISFGSQAERQIRFGQQVQGPKPSSSSSFCRAYSAEGKLIALLHYDAQTGLWQPKKVFGQEG